MKAAETDCTHEFTRLNSMTVFATYVKITMKSLQQGLTLD